MKNHNLCFQVTLFLWFSLFASLAMAQEQPAEAEVEKTPEPIALQKDLSIVQISDNVWMWAAAKNPDGKPPALNGLLYITDTMVICVNVPWNAKHVDGLSKFCLDRLQRRLGKLILTGYQPIRAPALKRFKDLGLQFHGTLANATLAQSGKLPAPDLVFTVRQTLEVDGRLIYLYNPGSILAKDHVIVYIPDGEVLYMGALLKSPRANISGLSQARLQAWEKALRDSQRRFPKAMHLIPERGPMTDHQAIARNYVLIRKATH